MTVKKHRTNGSALKARPGVEKGRPWVLRLYVAGQTPRAVTAYNNLKAICEDRLRGRYRIEVIDLVEKPQLARDDQILAVPTLVRRLPAPVRHIIGDLSETGRVLVGLDLSGPFRPPEPPR